MALSKSVLSVEPTGFRNNEEIVTVKLCFQEQPNPEAAKNLETFKSILENAAVDIVLKRYLQQVEERKNET